MEFWRQASNVRMGKKRKYENHPERLAKGASRTGAAARSGRARKDAVRAKPRRHARRMVADEREVFPLARFMGTFIADRRPMHRVNCKSHIAHDEWRPDLDLNQDTPT